MNNVKVLSNEPDVTLHFPSNPESPAFYRAELRVLIEGDVQPVRLVGHGDDEKTAISHVYRILATIKNREPLR